MKLCADDCITTCANCHYWQGDFFVIVLQALCSLKGEVTLESAGCEEFECHNHARVQALLAALKPGDVVWLCNMCGTVTRVMPDTAEFELCDNESGDVYRRPVEAVVVHKPH